MDPHVVLGGFPTGPTFRNYSADATAFVVTYPVNSDAGNVAAARAWEAAFVALARGKLSDMARGAGLALSFSSERSVQVRAALRFAVCGLLRVGWWRAAVAFLFFRALCAGACGPRVSVPVLPHSAPL